MLSRFNPVSLFISFQQSSYYYMVMALSVSNNDFIKPKNKTSNRGLNNVVMFVG